MLTFTRTVFFVLIAYAVLGICAVPARSDDTPQPAEGPSRETALSYYQKGVMAKTIGEREEAFEKALALYLAMFNEMKAEEKINGYICYNIGNCYFNLNQINQAIYYYRLGLSVLPGNETLTENLAIALNKRSDAVDIEIGWIKQTLLFFHYRISASARITVLIVCSIIASLLLMVLYFRRSTPAMYSAGILLVVSGVLFVSLAVSYYAPNHYGILLTTTNVRRGAGVNFAGITEKPLGGGSSVWVLSLKDGWYTVKLNDGRKGYVQQKDLKLVI